MIKIKYLESFLKIQNGFEFDGLIWYGTKDCENDFIDMNETWDWQGEAFEHKYLFLGDADISWYVYDIKEKCFKEIDKPSGDEIQKFIDFDTMLIDALRKKVKL